MSGFKLNDKVVVVGEGDENIKPGMVLTVVKLCTPNNKWITPTEVELDFIRTSGKYAVQHYVAGVADQTLKQIVDQVAALNDEQAGAEAALKDVAERREKLVAELNALGLTLVSNEPPKPQTMRDLYFASGDPSAHIKTGDKFKWTGANKDSWTTDSIYTVMRVDWDQSVSLTNDRSGDHDWVWESNNDFIKFVKVA